MFDDDIMSENCDDIAIFQLTANLEQAGFRTHSLKTYIFINSNLFSYKN